MTAAHIESKRRADPAWTRSSGVAPRRAGRLVPLLLGAALGLAPPAPASADDGTDAAATVTAAAEADADTSLRPGGHTGAHTGAPETRARRWLPDQPRSIPLADGASREIPALEYAYGPRAQLTLGHPLPIWERSGDRHLSVWTSALVALENESGLGPAPLELGRLRAELGTAVALDRRVGDALGAGGAFELGFLFGFERSRELRSSEVDNHLPAPSPGDIPFGAGGSWIGLDVSTQTRLSEKLTLTTRLADRVFMNQFAELFGGHLAGADVASALSEGLRNAPAADVVLRWEATERAQPVISVFAEGLLPHDDSADASYFVRGLLGVACVGARASILPFVSVDAGSGRGFLVNRHELRLSVGVRYGRD
ncbi:MAG: hypothetical protein H6697_06110 [Myxococcales bacterium]|nr:hypothetical protein [Myxococcales bacterium]MCB9519809.1 hypothetical protein [Myxococcales bacterium]